MRFVLIALLSLSMISSSAPAWAQSAPRDGSFLFEMEPEMPKSSASVEPAPNLIEFDESAASGAFLISFVLISAGGTIGSVLLNNRVDDPFIAVGLPTIATGFAVSSIVALQAGLKSKTIVAGVIAVILNAAVPIALGVSAQ